jgi:hypothetical protein
VRDESKPRRHPNRAERTALRVAELAVFVRQYGRKAQRGCEPNDRKYDRDTEKAVRRMRPDDFDRLLRDDEE